MTALKKPAGGIQGIVVGDVIRRLVVRTVLSHQRGASHRTFSIRTFHQSRLRVCVSRCPSIVRGEPEHHHCVSGRCERVGHNIAGSHDARTVRQRRRDNVALRPQFYGRVSQYLWEDDAGVTHTILAALLRPSPPRTRGKVAVLLAAASHKSGAIPKR